MGYKMQQFIDIALRRSPYKLNRVSHAPLSLSFYPSLSLSLCVFAFLLPPNVDVAVDPCGRFLFVAAAAADAGGVHELSPEMKSLDFYSQRKCAESFIRFVFCRVFKAQRGFHQLIQMSLSFRSLSHSLSLSVFFGQSKRISLQAMSIFKLLRFPNVFIASHKGEKCRLRYAYSLLSYLWSKLNSRQHFNN